MSRAGKHRILRVLTVLSTADAQAVPYELAGRIGRRGKVEMRVASFRGRYGSFPATDYAVPVLDLGARGLIDPRALTLLWRLIRNERFDIIHVHLWPSGTWGAVFGRLAGTRVVKTEHNDARHAGWAKRLMNLLVFPLLDRLACNSSATLGSFSRLERACLGSRAEVIYNGVDLDEAVRAAGRREARRADADFLLGAVGRFVEQKNYRRLLTAFAIALERAPRLRLRMVGDGELRDELEALARTLGVSHRIEFTGAVGREAVFAHLAEMDAFIVPSLWEGFCNAAVEAAGAATPIAAADLTVLREVLGPAARFFDPTSETAIAEAILALEATSLPALRNEGEAAQAFVLGRYGLDAAASAYEHLYAEVAP